MEKSFAAKRNRISFTRKSMTGKKMKVSEMSKLYSHYKAVNRAHPYHNFCDRQRFLFVSAGAAEKRVQIAKVPIELRNSYHVIKYSKGRSPSQKRDLHFHFGTQGKGFRTFDRLPGKS